MQLRWYGPTHSSLPSARLIGDRNTAARRVGAVPLSTRGVGTRTLSAWGVCARASANGIIGDGPSPTRNGREVILRSVSYHSMRRPIPTGGSSGQPVNLFKLVRSSSINSSEARRRQSRNDKRSNSTQEKLRERYPKQVHTRIGVRKFERGQKQREVRLTPWE